MSPKPVIHAVGSEFLQREGLSGTVMPWEDGLRADPGLGAFEWWYFDAELDDGSRLVIVFMTKLLIRRKDPLTPLVTATLTLPASAPGVPGERIALWQGADASTFSAEKESCHVRIGPSWVQGDLTTYSLHAEVQDLRADLTFTSGLPPFRPGAGKTFFDRRLQHYFAWLAPIPYGTVSGTLAFRGQERAVSGAGYHDHNWGNVALNEVLSHWYWGRARVGDYTAIFVQMVTTAAYGRQKLPVFMLAHKQRILTGDGAPLSLTLAGMERHIDGREYPTRLYFDWRQGGSAAHLALYNPELIESTSLLTSLQPNQAKLARLFANPYYFRFQAQLTLKAELAGLDETVSGPALYELMLLK